MTYALYDDAGKFQAGRVMSEAESSIQVELGPPTLPELAQGAGHAWAWVLWPCGPASRA